MSVPIRSLADRLRQVALFEVLGLALVTPLFPWASGQQGTSSLVLLAILAGVAALWNTAFASAVDWVQAHYFGLRADLRGWRARAVYALAFEGGLACLTLPIIAAWTGLSWFAALVADLGLALTYTLYAYLFNWVYDRCFPLGERSLAPETGGVE